MIKQPNIFESISNVIADIEAISKNKKNSMQGFMYRGIDDVYNTLNPLFGKHKIFTTSKIINAETKEVVSKSGSKMQHKIIRLQYKVYAVDGSYIETEVEGEAMDSGDKVTNKCMAIAHKYALMQLFVIPTENTDDPDKETPETIVDEEATKTKKEFIKQINESKDKTELLDIGLKISDCKYDFVKKDLQPIYRNKMKDFVNS